MRRTGALAALLVCAMATANAPGLRIAWDPPVELADGRGERGEWRQNDSRYDFVDDPAVAFADAALLVAWVDQRRKSVLVQRRDASGIARGPAVDVDRQPTTFSWIPRLAVSPDDGKTVLALWQEIIFSGGSHGGDMMVARSGDGGRSFSVPQNLSRSIGGDGKGRIRPDHWHNGSYELQFAPGGKAYAAWTEFDGPLWFARSDDGGRSFGKPRLVAGGRGDKPARLPSLAAHPSGAVLLAWAEGDHEGGDIQVARIDDRMQRAASLGDPARYDDAPVLSVGRDGVVHLAWAQSEGKPLQRQRVLYARSRDGGRTFEPGRAVIDAPSPYASAAYPSMAVDAAGGVVIVCELLTSLAQRPRAIAVTTSGDGGATFARAEPVPGSSDPRGGYNGSSQGVVRKLLLGADGRVLVVNSSLLEGSHSRIWMVPGRLAR